MNTKVIAIIAVAVVAIAGAATAVILMQPKETVSYDSTAFNIVSRVNSEGSGFFVDKDVANTSGTIPVRISNNVPFFGENFTYSAENKEAWGGLVMSDPGNQSIQHIQLATIASAVGLKFAQYTEGASLSADTLYYYTGLSDAGKVDGKKSYLDGGIIWEPQFERIVQESSKFVKLALTNDVFKGHACCVIAANHNWLGENSGTMLKFLAGYTKAVDYINEAKADPSGEKYADVVSIAKSKTVGLTDQEVKDSLSTITYLYADDASGSLGDLTKNIADLADELNDLNLITSKKFSSGSKVAKAMVDDKYLKDTIAGKASKDGTASVKVAVIKGDIHQLAIHVAIAKGYFSDYGLTVDTTDGDSGGDIATLLTSKDVQIGFLGAPPATLKTINAEQIIVS